MARAARKPREGAHPRYNLRRNALLSAHAYATAERRRRTDSRKLAEYAERFAPILAALCKSPFNYPRPPGVKPVCLANIAGEAHQVRVLKPEEIAKARALAAIGQERAALCTTGQEALRATFQQFADFLRSISR